MCTPHAWFSTSGLGALACRFQFGDNTPFHAVPIYQKYPSVKKNMHLDSDLRQCIIGHSGHSPLIVSACFWLRSLHLILRWSHLATCKGMVSTSWWVASRYFLLVSMAKHKMMSSNEFEHFQYILLWGLNKIYRNTWKFTVYSVCRLEWTVQHFFLSPSAYVCVDGTSVCL